MVKVTVKWNKESYDVDVDLSLPAEVFKMQLFSLTGVPAERQKVMGVKNAPLKDDADMAASGLKEGSKVMLLGSADAAPSAPAVPVVFLEDLPEGAQAQARLSPGLVNVGNTCYMNSSLQCLFGVPELKAALLSYGGAGAGEHDGAHRLTSAARDLFGELGRSGSAVTPFRFLATLRAVFPQFAAQGRGGVYMQQDAEECWTGILETLRQRLPAPPGAGGAQPPAFLRSLFGIDLATRLRCEQTGEERAEEKTEYTLKCNIVTASTHLTEGFKLALAEEREAHSAAAGATVLFKGQSAVARLPLYLTAQMMRFEFNRVTSERCKKTGEISFGVLLDMHPFCTPELQAALEAPRRRRKEAADRALADRHAAAATAAAAAAAGGDAAMADAPPAAEEATGYYELHAVLTHRGRTLDSGHYVAFVKQAEGGWLEFDDEKPIPRTEEQILRLRGGLADHHMAYLLLYRAVLA